MALAAAEIVGGALNAHSSRPDVNRQVTLCACLDCKIGLSVSFATCLGQVRPQLISGLAGDVWRALSQNKTRRHAPRLGWLTASAVSSRYGCPALRRSNRKTAEWSVEVSKKPVKRPSTLFRQIVRSQCGRQALCATAQVRLNGCKGGAKGRSCAINIVIFSMLYDLAQ